MLVGMRMIKKMVQAGIYGRMEWFMKVGLRKIRSNFIFIIFYYRHGNGVLTNMDGRIVKGVWENNKLVKIISHSGG